ncbi:MAG TPA: hypothetical protein VLT62_03570, partial [Candidatus Methylomirabilis sp.]|nr:hypothetical protein [Candidatus Methylomirabilis sp.]
MREQSDGATAAAIADLFACGNYTAVAMQGGRDEWRTYAALGLIGRTEAAIQGLHRWTHPEARFYSAVASWIGGDDAAAAGGLEGLSAPHAQNLLALIHQPRIHVLAQLPWFRSGPQDLLRGAARDDKFSVRNVSFHPED